jgi:iron complex outermembrane recepter protein
MRGILRCTVASAAAIVIVGAVSSPANAQAAVRFDLPAQSLAESLKAIARQSSTNVLFDLELVEGKQAPAVNGELTPEAAIVRLLAGSGFTHELVNEHTIVLTPVDAKRPAASQPDDAQDSSAAPRRIPAVSPRSAEERRIGSQNLETAEDIDRAGPPQRRKEEVEELEEVVVSATSSRIKRPGFVASTPTIVLTEEDLRRSGRDDLSSILADLPQARNSVSDTVGTDSAPEAARSSGTDLRGIGVTRTLMLIDGRRPVPVNDGGGVNINSIPLGMVERVEVVTGGASAAYGSDAVAGVVNVIMARKNDGFRASASYGDTTDRAGSKYKLDASYGFSFAEDRAHVIVGGNYSDSNTIGPQSRNPAYGWGPVANPAWTPTNGEPQSLLRPDVNYANRSLGGLIIGCGTGAPPPGAPPPGGGGVVVGPGGPLGPGGGGQSANCGPLTGLTFESDGSSRPFVLGQFATEDAMSGGDVQATNLTHYTNIRAPITRGNGFGRFTFDLAENVRLRTDLAYSRTTSDSSVLLGTAVSEFDIAVDNAFLPADIRAAMQAAGLQTIRIGRVNADWGLTHFTSTASTREGVVGLEGTFGKSWSWDTFFNYGKSRSEREVTNQVMHARLAAAIDSVLVNGVPTCRNLATNPGCVPLNIFGQGNASQSALDYFRGPDMYAIDMSQREASGVLRGDPFSLWAGPVSIATGGEWRSQELQHSVNDLAATGVFGPPLPITTAKDEVKEGFIEAVVPLAKGLPLMQALTFNGAFRRSDYERAGFANSWKIGVTNDLSDELRLRFTRSADIRAPSLVEIYQPRQEAPGMVNDPRTNNPVSVTMVNGGTSDNLRAEQGLTTTFGLVYHPSWAPGLDLSADYYKIDITGFITPLFPQQVVDRCFAGNAALCAELTLDGTGAITHVNTGIMNLANLVAKGVDFEAAHTFDLAAVATPLPGQLMSRLMLSYVDELTYSDGVTAENQVGLVASSGMPRLRATLSEGYRWDNLWFNVRARYTHGGDRTRKYTLDSNHVGSMTYVDLGAGYRTSLFGDLEISCNVLNVFDRSPPRDPVPQIYDVIGRSFTVSARTNFDFGRKAR